MKKLSEYEGEEALDVLADLIGPMSKIMSDTTIRESAKNDTKFVMISKLIKAHKSNIIEILAVLEGVPKAEYKCNLLTLPMVLMNLMQDADFMDFFATQGRIFQSSASGSATENTEAGEQ